MIRWAEFALGSRLSSSKTKFILIFHAEGLVNGKIVRTLSEFGKDLEGTYRPLLTAITPYCPQYHVDPLKDPKRLEFSASGMSGGAERQFASALGELSSFYDVGYHGHFFKLEGDVYRPSFEEQTIASQFASEYKLLKQLGFGPVSYSGGWWYISPFIVSQLASFGFTSDSTINDVHLDSFGRVQPYAQTQIGVPFWLGAGLLEVPSVRSLASLGNILAGRRKEPNFVAIALHDYDLLNGPTNRLIRRVVGALAKKDRIFSGNQLVDEAVRWLRSASERPHR